MNTYSRAKTGQQDNWRTVRGDKDMGSDNNELTEDSRDTGDFKRQGNNGKTNEGK